MVPSGTSEPEAAELISCIMVTRDRPAFVRQALRCFARQTHSNAELIVIDDGAEPVAALCEGAAHVRYIHTGRAVSTGAKLNIGIECARGDLLQKLDDDDYYHPEFLEIAARHMARSGRDQSLAAWDCFLMLIAGDGNLRYSGHGWTIGNTFCFTRKFWSGAPFRDLARGSDAHFLRDRKLTLVRVCAPELCIVVRHGANTWMNMRSGESVNDYFRRFPVHSRPLAAVVPAEDLAFYEAISTGAAASGTASETSSAASETARTV
jgi:glycosyltransferase involved in cell wall biosynthesis